MGVPWLFVSVASSGRMRIASKSHRGIGGDNTMSEIQALDVRIPAEIIHNWGWFLAFGIGLVLLGVLAIVRSVAATVVSILFFGWLLVIAAGIEVARAIRERYRLCQNSR